MQVFSNFVHAEGRLQALKNSSICYWFVGFQRNDFCSRILSRASREAPATSLQKPRGGLGRPRGRLGRPQGLPETPIQVAENVTKIGVPGKCAPRPRREAYFFKNRALTTGASTTFQIEVMKKSQKNGEKVTAAAARARISICVKNDWTHVATWKSSKLWNSEIFQ